MVNPQPVAAYLITPPFTQLNTPYPATAYLKGFLNTKGISSFQSDLGLEVTLRLFSEAGLTAVFAQSPIGTTCSPNAERVRSLSATYIRVIGSVIRFLQGKDPTLAHRIAARRFLPEAGRFAQLPDLDFHFGVMGIQDKAKFLATMMLEDLSDYIQEMVDPHFGLSRYAERLGRSANSFDGLAEALSRPPGLIDGLLLDLLQSRIECLSPQLVGLSVPFPGNLFSALRIGQWLRAARPNIKVVMGGGFANTELRSLSDPRVFDYVDFITLDDGESPIEQLLSYISGDISSERLKRTFVRENGAVRFYNNPDCRDYKQGQVGTPDYCDLLVDEYISAIEVTNPMHSLWSDGRWNKLTMAHGCYWGKCTFCDISLPYISHYEPLTASLLCDRMEQIIAQTGTTGFHFVDEAAPPALMRSLSLEILRRGLVVSWWANIRFEKSFTRDLCVLLQAAGCMAVSGGLEVASDRLLTLIDKGITVAQVAQVNKNFRELGIMVHAYLMYGFPTQTAQETIDSLEMVRQMFAAGILQSAFWHQFAMTTHSPVGRAPEAFGVMRESQATGAFANNDLSHIDPIGGDHERFSFGLRKSLMNYMNGACLDYPLHKWFDFKVPKTRVNPDYIIKLLQDETYQPLRDNAQIVFLGEQPQVKRITKNKKGASWEVMSLLFDTTSGVMDVRLEPQYGEWLTARLPEWSYHNARKTTLADVRASFSAAGLIDFELFWENKPMNTLWRAGLLQL